METLIRTSEQNIKRAEDAVKAYIKESEAIWQKTEKARANANISSFIDDFLTAQKKFSETYLDYANVVSKALTDFGAFDLRF